MSVIISVVLSLIIICCTLINIYIFIKSKKLNTRSGNEKTKAINNKNKQGKTLKNSINSNQPQKKRTDNFGNIEIEDLDGYNEVEIRKALTDNGQESIEKNSSKVKVDESNNIIRNDLVINRDE